MEKYVLTKEHEAQIEPWTRKWIANALSTKPMDNEDRKAMIVAIQGLYVAANLPVPPVERIIFVQSPLIGNVVAGIAAALWHTKKKFSLKSFDVLNATENQKTDAAFVIANNAINSILPEGMVLKEPKSLNSKKKNWVKNLIGNYLPNEEDFGKECVKSAWRMANPGNHWSSWVCFLSFFKDIAKLDLPIYEKYRHYEAATIHGSWRWMHSDFCIISDRPSVLKIDAQNRPHCADGPSHAWRDGWRPYHWKGLRIPGELIENRLTMTPEYIRSIQNAEHRRCAIEIYASVHGPEAFYKNLQAKIISEDVCNGLPRKLLEVDGARFVHVINGSLEPDGTRREFILGAISTARTPHEAIAASYGLPPDKYKEAVRT